MIANLRALLRTAARAFLTASAIACVPVSAAADPAPHKSAGIEREAQGGAVTVRVRMVRASGRLEDAHAAPRVDRQLRDLEQKLRHLNFSTFELISSARQLVPVMKKRTLDFASGDTLTLRPLYIDGDSNVGLWLKWRDPRGSQMLDTRLHFKCGEAMLTGADRQQAAEAAHGEARDGGIILAIDVEPQPGATPAR